METISFLGAGRQQMGFRKDLMGFLVKQKGHRVFLVGPPGARKAMKQPGVRKSGLPRP